MKIKTNLSAGMTFEECDQQRNWWKQQAQMMNAYLQSSDTYPPAGLWYPCATTPPPTYPPTTYPPTTSGGGYVNGVYYPDMSGVCGGTTTPKPPTTGGGYVNGVYYPDMSGVCV
jgi:hypothetical protein